ncbi:MAG: manganese efflux pump [Clostridia bacterium]|nr:manganese efflux pump [Clostridia bacterium]
MSIFEILLLSFALAMDAFAVSISVGVCSRDLAKPNALKCGLSFGIFQGGMLLIGILTANLFASFISPFSHWIAFVLLMYIGIKMIHESLTSEESVIMSGFKSLLILSIATSIDALAAGISLAVVSVSFALPVALVAIITFALSYFGVFLGAAISRNTPGKIFDVIGGIILIGLAIKTLLAHFIG